MSGAVSSFPDTGDVVSAIGAMAFGALGVGVLLGPFLFSGFEVPEYIGIGGTQQMTVHKLPGGTRVVDLLGPDERDLDWSGTMIDTLPSLRAAELDMMRAGGQPWPLVWGTNFYTVIVRSFEAETHYSLIKYRISCLVLRNDATALLASLPGVTDQVASDLATAAIAASSVAALVVAQSAVGGLGELVPGSQSMALAAAAIVPAAVAMTAARAAAEGGFAPVAGVAGPLNGTAGLTAAVAAAGTMASLSQAAGYLGRAQGNVTAVT
jgi:hypothetical protein